MIKKLLPILIPVAFLFSPLLAQNEKMPNWSKTEKPGIWEAIWKKTQVSANIGYESELVERGAKIGQNAIIPSAEIAYSWHKAFIYGGMVAVAPMGPSRFKATQQIDPYFGLAYDVTDIFTVDAGVWFKCYTKKNPTMPQYRRNLNRSRELYLGIQADVILRPTFYLFYNVDLQQWVFEPSFGHTLDLEDMGLKNFGLDWHAKIGYLQAQKFNGNQLPAGTMNHRNGYCYYSMGLDLRYNFNEHAFFTIGPRLAGNNDSNVSLPSGTMYSANIGGRPRNMFWWGASIGVEF